MVVLLQCGVLLGAAVMCHAYASGCRKAELLAINDDDRQHQRLKTFYRMYVSGQARNKEAAGGANDG